ncbi:kinase-like domain-containing protein [Apiosordaria backusii]|uniref:Kinase-like domain-containing protein n=1 Tax=Apiosordaria backusii TaxID=314023 RepID=A0AA40K7K5_9PEZI|nr:kinase-like domain-containing protein [Apiosordaria backusii]
MASKSHPKSHQVAEQVQEELSSTPYKLTSLQPLSGGLANFIFKGRLTNPLPNSSYEVAIKHGESFIAGMPDSDWVIPTTRCQVEEECLKAVQSMPTPSAPCVTRTPKLYYYNSATNTQVQEYLPDAISLKDYALKHFSSTRDASRKPVCLDIGKSLGIWLRSFHDWANQPEQSALREALKKNANLQELRHMTNYQTLVSDVDTYPEILSDAKDVFEQVEKMAAEELKNGNLEVIHGDFWTGNTLLADRPFEESKHPNLYIVDWEMCQLNVHPLDLGQMTAELYELFLFKDIEEGKWIIEGFLSGYGDIDGKFAYRVAIQVGTHLIVWGSRAQGWGTKEQVAEVMAKGKEIIVKAWHKDRAWFEAGDLSCLFSRRS